MRIAAVVVTHNRPQLLARVIDAVRAQTRAPDRIFIVDNASDAPTRLLLADQSDLVVIRSESNLGGTGGFTRGMQEACADAADWIWLLDDDAIPRKEALRVLAEGVGSLPATTGAVCGAVREFGDIATMHRRYFTTLLGIERAIPRHAYGDSPVAIDTGSFVGFMVSTHAIGVVGYPDPAFFLAYDDTEYSLRLKRSGFGLWLLPGSIVDHLRTAEGRLRATGFERKHYFNVRNRIIVKRKYAVFQTLSGYTACLFGVGLWLRSQGRFQRKPFRILCAAITDGCNARLGNFPVALSSPHQKT